MGMLSVSFSGLGRLEVLLARLQRFSTRGLMLRLGELAKRDHIRRVTSEKTSPDGEAWAPLQPSTVEKKGSSEIMVESGRLAAAFVLTDLGNIARIWSSSPYLRFHQGGAHGWHGSVIPARPIIGLSVANVAEIAVAANAFVAARLGV